MVFLQLRAGWPQEKLLKSIGQNSLFTLNLNKYGAVKGWHQWRWFSSPPWQYNIKGGVIPSEVSADASAYTGMTRVWSDAFEVPVLLLHLAMWNQAAEVMPTACLAATVLCQWRPGCSGVTVIPYVYLFRDYPGGKIGKAPFGEARQLCRWLDQFAPQGFI